MRMTDSRTPFPRFDFALPRLTASRLAIAAAAVLLLGCPAREESGYEPGAPEGETLIAAAPVPCPPDTEVAGHDLTAPRVIRAVDQPGGGSLVDTKLVIRKVTHQCIPLNKGGQWVWEPMELRTYGAPVNGNDPGDDNLEFTIPGPTYRVRKARLEDVQRAPGSDNPEIVQGTRFRLLLQNRLPNNPYPYDECEVAEYVGCVGEDGKQPIDPNTGFPMLCTRTTVDDPYTCPQQGFQCRPFEVPQVSPECFHGADVTNLHYHGSHVSPQPHQDYVLLKLFSSEQTDPPPPCGPPGSENPCDATGPYAVGDYQTDINPLPWNQPPGTHWYHPHNHGSTALQVLNGLAGTLIVEGEFDDWLNGFYGVETPAELDAFERLLVVGQNWPDNVFYLDGPGRQAQGYPPYPLVNGQAIPKTKMQWGEVQRWRFVGATVQSSAQVALQFPEGFEVRQIAQDGVQFSPGNYASQPLRVVITQNGQQVTKYLLAPGNRLDFLVKAPWPPPPEEAEGPRTFRMLHSTFGHLQEEVHDQLEERRDALRTQFLEENPSIGILAAEQFTEALFTIEVDGEKEMPLPTPAEFPAMPYYLRPIDPKASVADKELLFSMTYPPGAEQGGQTSTPGSPFNGFWINNRQYSPDCADVSMDVGTVETWKLSNDSTPNHPFHIHINPFQVTEVRGLYSRLGPNRESKVMDVKYDDPVWQDTIALPAPANGQNGYVKILQRFEDYSGAFVLHCHFLGHEDRGMMFNVQTKCAEQGKFGTPRADGGEDDCTQPANLTPNPYPQCVPGGY